MTMRTVRTIGAGRWANTLWSGTAATLAVSLAGCLTVWSVVLSSETTAELLALTGGAGTLALAVGVAIAFPTVIGSGVGAVGLAYTLHLVLDDPPLDARASIVAAGLLAAAELASWSIELRRDTAGEPGRHLRRLAFELALVLGGLLLAAGLLATADVSQVGGVGIELVGGAAAAGLLGLALLGVRRSPEH
jgi:hypothetical protein